MSAPAVKPVLPAASAGGQASTPNAASPLKNHSNAPNSVTVSIVNNDKTPEKPKEAAPAASPKPTPNGVEVGKSGTPPTIEKKGGDTNHVANATPPTVPASTTATAVNNAAQNATPTTANPPKGTPEKAPTANSTSSSATTDASPPKSTAPAAPAPATTATPASPTKTNSAPPVEEKEKSASPATPKRGAEKPEKADKEKDKDKDKVATASRAKRKRDLVPPTTPAFSEDADSSKAKRTRVPVQPYQSPMPDLFVPKIKTPAKTPVVKEKEKDSDKERLVIFYKNEFLAVRNSDGGFYVCQARQNIFKSSHKIKIRWLSQVESDQSEDGTIYSPDFYDKTDFDCILTSLRLQRVDKDKFNLSKEETLRTENILKRALDVEKGVAVAPDLTEEHPDGLDLSLFNSEAQLKKRRSQGKAASGSPKRARRSVSPKKEGKPKVEKKKPAPRTPIVTARVPSSPRGAAAAAKKTRAAPKTPVVEKKVTKEEKSTAQSTASRRSERASEREKAKDTPPAKEATPTPAKAPAKRKADSSPAPAAENKVSRTQAPKTTARTAASAKKAAAEARANAQAAIAAKEAKEAAAAASTSTAPAPGGRKPPARGRRGGAEPAAEPEASLPTPSRATKRNARASSPAEAEKKEVAEAAKEEATPKPTEAAEAPSTAPAVPAAEAAPATTASATPAAAAAPPAAAAPAASPATTPADAPATAEQKAPATADPATPAAAGSDSPATSEADSNRGTTKKPAAPSPPKKA